MPEPLPSVDWKALGAELSAIVSAEIAGVVDGAADDVVTFAQQVALDATRAIQLGRPELGAEVLAQLRALAELNRLRLVGAQWAVVDRLVGVLVRVGIAALGSVSGISLQPRTGP